jgi:hypothetical protein
VQIRCFRNERRHSSQEGDASPFARAAAKLIKLVSRSAGQSNGSAWPLSALFQVCIIIDHTADGCAPWMPAPAPAVTLYKWSRIHQTRFKKNRQLFITAATKEPAARGDRVRGPAFYFHWLPDDCEICVLMEYNFGCAGWEVERTLPCHEGVGSSRRLMWFISKGYNLARHFLSERQIPN